MCSQLRSSWKVLAVSVVTTFGLLGPTLGQQPPPTQETALPPASPALPSISSGTVTLPYGELKALWEAAQLKVGPTTPAKAPAPPVAFSVQSARYEVSSSDDARQVTGQAVFEVIGFTEGWTAVPLLPAQEILLSGVEPEGTLVAIRDGKYTLFLDHPGRRSVTLRFSADVREEKTTGERALRLSGPSALINELRVSGVPEGWLAEVPNAARAPKDSPVTTADARRGGNASPDVFRLPADQPLVLNLINAQERKPAPPPVPSVWQMDAQALVRYDEGRLVYKARLRLGTDAGTGTTADLLLPATTSVLSVSGEDLDYWHVVKSEAAGTRRLEVAWKTPDTLRHELLLTYEVPQPSAEGEWHLNTPQVASNGGRLRSAQYILPMIEGAEFIPDEGNSSLPAGDPRQLPRWLANDLADASFAVVNQDKPAPTDNSIALVRVHRLPLVRTVRATVEQSRFRTRLVADGALLCEGTVTVRHDGPQTVELILPKEAQLLSCSVNAHDALPVDRGGGRIDLMLPVEPAGKTTQIDLSYTGHQPALAPVAGRVALALPEINLFVQTLLWELQIPEEYELTALEGNVTLAPAAANPTSSGPPMIRLRKELLKGEQPSAELFYQKRAATP